MKRFLIPASVLLAGCSTAAMAQVETLPATGEGDAANPTGLEEIVVTAQRRTESTQKASVSIDVVGADELTKRGVSTASGLNGLVPGLSVSVGAGGTLFYIRGVGDGASNSAASSPIALNIDGVPVSRSSSFSGSFFDVARVEVLRGPQGTLYGRNASGGIVNLLSNKPVIGDTSGSASVEIGDYSLRQVEGVANVAAGDTLALRAAFQTVRRDGYLTDGRNDQRTDAARLKALWQPDSDVNIVFSLDGARFGGLNTGRVFRPNTTSNPWTGPGDPANNVISFPNLTKRSQGFVDSYQVNASTEINWDIGPVTLTVLPAYRYTNANTGGMSDLFFAEDYVAKQYSLETRLAHNGDRFKWVVGNFLFKERLHSVISTNNTKVALATAGAFVGNPTGGQTVSSVIPKQNSGSYAFFADGTLEVVPDIRILGGLRYTHDDKQTEARSITTAYAASGAPTVTDVPFNRSKTWSAVTWKAGIEADFASASMFYATGSKGYKTGGFVPDTQVQYNPEYLTAFDVGVKNRFFDNRLQFNLSAFYWKYKNQQVSFVGVDAASGILGPLINNAGKSTLYGFNVDLALKITPNDLLSGSVEYARTNYDSFIINTFRPGPAPAAGTLLTNGCISGGSGGVNQVINDCSGYALVRAPKWAGNVDYSHRFDLANGGDLTFGAHFNFSSRFNISASNLISPNFYQNSYAKIDLDLTYKAPGERWELGVWGRNLTNQPVYDSGGSASSVTPQLGSGLAAPSVSTVGAPRTYGARFRVKF
jgi:iron complex outermembrane recepter protein